MQLGPQDVVATGLTTSASPSSALGKLVDHEAPDPPAAGLPAPDGHVAAGAVDRRAGLRDLSLLVRPDVHRMIPGDKEIGALQDERGNAVLRHLVDDQRMDGRAIEVRSTREQKLDVTGEPPERQRRIALEPRLTVLLEGGIHRRTVGGSIGHRWAPACGDDEGESDHEAGLYERSHRGFALLSQGCRIR